MDNADLNDHPLVLLDETNEDENHRKVVLDIDFDKFMGILKDSPESLSKVEYTVNESIMLADEGFLQTVDIYAVDKERVGETPDLEDFFSSADEEHDPEPVQQVPSIHIHPYTEREELSKKTGRDYIAEANEAFEFLTRLADTIENHQDLSEFVQA